MSKSLKQEIVTAVSDLLLSVSVTPEPGSTTVSRSLFDAIREIAAEVAKGRTDWHLVAALTGVKSYICGARPEDETKCHFWEVRTEDEGRDVYAILDAVHFRAASHVGVLPSGVTAFIGTCEGMAVHSGEIDTSASSTSPTLRLIAEERARIEAGSAEVRASSDVVSSVTLITLTSPSSQTHED